MKSSFEDPLKSILGSSGGEERIFKSGVGTRALLLHSLLVKGERPVYLAKDYNELAEIRSLLTMLSPREGPALWDGDWLALPPFFTRARHGGEKHSWARRLAVLFALGYDKRPRGLLLTPDSLLFRWPPRELFNNQHLELNKGEELAPEMVLELATGWGYERVLLVTRPGEIARRGDILDLFAPGYEWPLRFEFFGETLEDIRLFDPVSQRSKANLDSVLLIPSAPAVLNNERQEAAKKRWKKTLTPDLQSLLIRRLEGADSCLFPGIYYDKTSSVRDWIAKDPIWLFSSQDAPDAISGVRTLLEEARWDWNRYLNDWLQEHGTGVDKDKALPILEDAVFQDQGTLEKTLASERILHFAELVMGAEKVGLDLPESEILSFEALLAMHDEPELQLSRERPWNSLVKLLEYWNHRNRQTILSFSSEQARKKFLKLAGQEGIRPRTEYISSIKGLFALVSPFAKGLNIRWRQTLILGEDVLEPGGRRRAPVPSKDFKGLTRFDDLQPGDLLVHREYGLGKFAGLERMDIDGTGNDFLLITYAGDGKLYLPVDRLSTVQRYKGPEDSSPVLDKLGGVSWSKARERARKAIEKIAHDLVEMYAYRKIAKGYSYEPVGEMYREFEVSFGFEETPDQDRAIQDVLQDMERPEPMDRLVCGDVGFGKTEVAMRAAFRAAYEGRQVVLLCPTTVLAEQHFQNFRARFKGFPINISMLSRFVPAKKQAKIIEAAKRGQVDILIGTHRLLSQDVVLPEAGLLILDEEQRFGVKHKERLKKLRKNIDVLTLTATPIPRTLQLSLAGIRGLSVIETPPTDRKPVETAVVERDEGLLRQVVQRELDREGQVFWVHNRVQGLERVVEFVQKLVPHARVGMAHGQMAERQLEEAMHTFWHGEMDVLVCTAIIESGLDFPRANTLIVDQAQMFGLGQLYQLRGRVGRSDRQAYAYFVTRKVDALPENARKRLKVIMDMDYLGAGFQVAMEDLRLRGAGNILGESQTGHIAKIGLDLFLEMLEDEVRRLKGEPLREETEPELHIGFTAHIPETYIPDARDRLHYYRALTRQKHAADSEELVAEIADRYGQLPEALELFLKVLALKRLLAKLQVVRADLHTTGLKVRWGEQTEAVSPETIVGWVAAHSRQARLLPPSNLEYSYVDEKDLAQNLDEALENLSGLLDKHTSQTEE